MDWLNTSLNADLFVMPSPRLELRTTRFPPSMADDIAAVPGVARVQRYRSGRIMFHGGPAMLGKSRPPTKFSPAVSRSGGRTG